MPLNTQEIEIPLNLGMSTKPSAELAQPDAMRLVQNLHWRGQGEIEKRPVHGNSYTVNEPTGSLYDEADACGLVVRDKSPIIVTGKHGLAVYSDYLGTVQWTHARDDVTNTPSSTGTLNYCPVSYDVSRRFVERAQGNLLDSGIFQVASAQYGGIHVIAWVSSGSTSRLYCKAIAVDTGETVATTEYDALASGSALMVQACEYTESGKEGVLIAYIDDASSPYTISTIRWNAATNQFVTDSALKTNAVSRTFTIVKNGTRIYFAYHDDASGFLKVEDRTIGAISSTHTATHGAYGVDVVVGASRTLIVSCTDTTAYAEVFGQPADAISIAASSETFYKVTAAAETRSGTSNDAVMLITSQTSGTPSSTRVLVYEVNYTNNAPTAPNTMNLPHCVTVANAFTLRGMAHAVVTVYTRVNAVNATTATSCYIARFRSNGTGWMRMDAVAKVAHDRFFITEYLSFDPGHPGLGKQGNSVYVDSNNNAWMALTADRSPSFAVNNAYYPQSIVLARISAARPMPMPYTSPEPGIVFVAGGVPWEFDGDMASEASALALPVAIVDVSGGTGQTGVFGIIPVYNWIDSAGRLHRMVGAAVTATCTGGTANRQIDVYVSKCPMRAYGHGSSVALDMEPQLYITAAGGSTYYLALDSSNNVDKYDSATSDGLWYKFTNVLPGAAGDPELAIGAAPLELSPTPPPAFSYVEKVVDRLWAIDAEDRSRIWHSKPIVPGYAVEWASENTLTIADDCVAIVDMGGGPAILARGGIYYVDGEGPDATGVGGFSPARKLNHNVDCIDPVSVCRTPLGVVFRGRRGFYILGNDMSAQPWAVPIDPEILTDPALDPSVSTSYRMRVVFQELTNEIHISQTPQASNAYKFVYNMLEGKWSRYVTSGVTYSDLAVVRGKLWALNRVSGVDTLRDEKTYAHDGAAYNSDTQSYDLDTPWYRLDEVSGQVRLWRAWFAFKLPSDVADVTSVSISYYIDNYDTVQQTVTFTGSELNTAYSTTEQVARLLFIPNVQVVHSFRFSISCTFASATSGPKPLSMRLRFGVRPSKTKRNKLAGKG